MNNELYHHKYVKRVWDPNEQRYKYYYKKKKTGSGLKNHVKDAWGYDEEKAYNDAKKAHENHQKKQEYYDKQLKNTPKYSPDRDEIKKKRDREGASSADAYWLSEDIKNDYRKTPRYGAKKIGNNVDKGKKWFNKKFSKKL